ncbi:hypothetical protein ACJ6WF_17080 [Streptomyces sp. MMS24-I2-30]|uniref:hypothetical protein n=1 Tax=Streptomyces sp. MMS24-I2-30 TaxID=3351564 RepID=UPI0038968A3F
MEFNFRADEVAEIESDGARIASYATGTVSAASPREAKRFVENDLRARGWEVLGNITLTAK